MSNLSLDDRALLERLQNDLCAGGVEMQAWRRTLDEAQRETLAGLIQRGYVFTIGTSLLIRGAKVIPEMMG